MPRRVLIAMCVGVVSLTANAARAQDGTAISAEIGTHLPLQVNGRVRLHLPGGLYVGGGVGWMPGAYVGVINDLATAYDAYGEATADLIRESLDDSLLLDATVGWDPGGYGGFRFGGHYTYTTLGSGVSARSAFEAATGLTVPAQVPDLVIPLESRLHMLGVSVGLLWELGPLQIGTELAVRFPVAAHSFLAVDAQGPAVDVVQDRVDEFFDDALLGLVVPSAGVYVGMKL